jgi:hypothetical protein
MAAKAKTFIEDRAVIVDVLTGPSSSGFCKVAYGRKELARHIDQLEPANEEGVFFLRRAKLSAFIGSLTPAQKDTISAVSRLSGCTK